MNSKRSFQRLALLVLVLGAGAAGRSEEGDAAATATATADHSRAGTFGISGDMGYYTYGMEDVNNRFLNGREGSLNGGLGYGAAAKLRLTENLGVKVGMDYLFASTPSTRTIRGIKYNSQVDLPATLLFIGGEFVFLPLKVADLKIIAGYTLVTIFDGREKSTGNNSLDLGAVSGSGSGAQVGTGLELFLGKGFSLEADLAYNFARIDGATFAGAPADPDSVNRNGTVDYSGLVAKLAFTIFLNP